MSQSKGRAFWQRVVADVDAGMAQTEAARKYGVSASGLGYWVRRLRREPVRPGEVLRHADVARAVDPAHPIVEYNCKRVYQIRRALLSLRAVEPAAGDLLQALRAKRGVGFCVHVATPSIRIIDERESP